MSEKNQTKTITIELDPETYDSLAEVAARDEISIEDCAYNLISEGLYLEEEDESWEDEEDDDGDDEPEHRDPWGKGT